jgi:hypothetical protein
MARIKNAALRAFDGKTLSVERKMSLEETETMASLEERFIEAQQAVQQIGPPRNGVVAPERRQLETVANELSALRRELQTPATPLALAAWLIRNIRNDAIATVAESRAYLDLLSKLEAIPENTAVIELDDDEVSRIRKALENSAGSFGLNLAILDDAFGVVVEEEVAVSGSDPT